jgi:hypothetical protein
MLDKDVFRISPAFFCRHAISTFPLNPNLHLRQAEQPQLKHQLQGADDGLRWWIGDR